MERTSQHRDTLSLMLRRTPAGSLKPSSELLTAVTNVWPTVTGSEVENTWADKTVRMESVEWRPPTLSFVLARHGGTVNGSGREHLHYWALDTDTWVAAIVRYGHRQLRPMSKRFDAAAAAETTAKLIAASSDDKQLVWTDNRRTVAINLQEAVPLGNLQTQAARRRRFRSELNLVLTSMGWREIRGKNRPTYTLEKE